ncbi:MAG: RagB/SusD family nutrient uptake outer membrane protein [Prevotella sp.]|jgi:tetratricopeptide (TPR) repeat protein
MKKLIIPLLCLTALTACDDRLDITPKGESTLQKATDLEMLFNQNYDLGIPYNDLGIVCNEALGMGSNVTVQLTQTSTNTYAYLAYDENVDRASLTLEDTRYSNAYKYINYMNTIIDKMPDADGEDSVKTRLIAEAHVMRGYLHWLLVNIYAKQYDASTAATEGGIAYVTDLDVNKQNQKLTVAEVYEKILEDCSDENIALLPRYSSDVLRGDQAWGNAVRAKVLMQMKRYDEALPYALKALAINGRIEDRSSVVEAGDWILTRQSPDNYIYFGTIPAPFMEVLSPETVALFERGDYVKDYAYLFGQKPGTGDDSDEEEDAKQQTYQVSPLLSDSLDESDDSTETDDTPVNAESPAWSTLYGYLMSGIPGSAMYYAMSSYINAYGITSDRMYYTAAECYIRTGQVQKGLDLINQVRQYRIDAAHYQPLQADNEKDAMALLQPCKWIECICTYENFFDCKRWNTESDYRRTITRTLYDSEGNAKTYSLSPDSPLWVFPFPQNATTRNSSLTQNY